MILTRFGCLALSLFFLASVSSLVNTATGSNDANEPQIHRALQVSTRKPTTSRPTRRPTNRPTTRPTRKPTTSPTRRPTNRPTTRPTRKPTPSRPTRRPTNRPTTRPTRKPTTSRPTRKPSLRPTTRKPSTKPSTESPTKSPTAVPTTSPTAAPSNSPVTAAPSTAEGSVIGAINVPIIPRTNAHVTVKLPPSMSNQLITMSQVSSDNDDEVPVTRSYDGLPFETLYPLLLPVNCSAGTCTVVLPPKGEYVTHYILKQYDPPAKTAAQKWAKLLLQGSYGPTQTSLSESMSMSSAAAWVRDQMNKPASLLRAHYRQRANAHIRNDHYQHGTRLACEPGSRWNRHAFNRWRDVGKTIVEEPTGRATWFLKVDGIVRTEVATRPSQSLSSSYVICRNGGETSRPISSFAEAPGGIKGKLFVAPTSTACQDMMMITTVDMPSVFFHTQGTIPTVNLVSLNDPNVIQDKILQSIVLPSTCNNFKRTWPNFVKDSATGLYFVEDRRVELLDNTNGTATKKKRLLDGQCPQAEKTFVNEDLCVVRTDCAAPAFSGDFVLNATNIRKFYEVDGKYVYRIQNLPIVDTPSPCTKSSSRFVRKTDTAGCTSDSSGSFPTIRTALENFLNNVPVGDRGTKRVVDLPETPWNVNQRCTDSSNTATGKSFTVTLPGGGLSCWTHSYPWEWSVLVMNNWVLNHPGNPSKFRASKVNPIAESADRDPNLGNLESSVTISYPSWHNDNFHNNRWQFDVDRIGNWGDKILFNSLPDSASSANVVISLGGAVVEESRKIIEVCGSPGEVSNDPQLGHQYLLQKYDDADEKYPDDLEQDHARWASSKTVWTTVTLTAPDQLRQRVAHALASIFVVTEQDISFENVAEPWGAYYDIFVRGAFGSSFFKMLKEVAFSPLMGFMLTYEGSKSQAYHQEKSGVGLSPDENFAREIMQLFSIGLFMLNPDGTRKIDPVSGQPIPTYTNEDIINFSRGWTNFKRREKERDNIEAEWDLGWMVNTIDPMHLPTSDGRDVFPKQSLSVDGKRSHIGDQRLPRCDALPAKAWLRKGAVWQFRENSQSIMGKQDPEWWTSPEDWSPRMILDRDTSNLYKKLCNKNIQTGKCQFRSTVVLDEDIACVGTCRAARAKWDGPIPASCECSVDEPRTVRIDHSTAIAPVWYEYVRTPCIQMAFPESSNMRTVKEIGGSPYGNKAMCADARFAVAGTTCCDSKGTPLNICIFRGERTTFNTASDRCTAYGTGYSTCAWNTVSPNWDCGTDVDYNDWSSHTSVGMRFSWTSSTCSMKVQIDPDGHVAMIHSVGTNTVKERVAVDVGTYFGVFWDAGSYPKASSLCGGIATCQVRSDSTCLCDTTVQTVAVFDGSFKPTVEQLLSQLHIGSIDPSLLSAKYSKCPTQICSNQTEYEIWIINQVTNFASAFDAGTIFKLTDPMTGEGLFLSNTKSTVSVGGGMSFRNPPMFNSPVDPTQNQALLETDEIIRTYVRHPNTAPFIATKLIQNLVTSNPSPRYVKIAADAFKTGRYSSNGINFGSGSYGDLEATVAAIMLDSEARSETLDEDSNHGRSREPLLKIMHLYRSMQLSTATGFNREIDMVYLTERGIGQEAHRAPSVFGFFLSEYSPAGVVSNKGLVAPETQLFDAPKLMSFINGLFSVSNYGLSDCVWWQGFGDSFSRYILPDNPDQGQYNCEYDPALFKGVQNSLRWKPPSWGGQTNVNAATALQVIDNIDLLLTGGRLNQANKNLLVQIYNSARTGSNPDNKALNTVLSHYSAVPEFHMTSSSLSTTSIRAVPNITIPANPPPIQGYKAIVYLFMAGAADSFSMLAPTIACGNLYSQYTNIRGDIAIPSSSLLGISASNQTCNSLGLHPSLVNIRNLYNTGDAAWIANVGPLVRHLTNVQYNEGSTPVPPALFAHNTQTQITQAVFAQDSTAGGVLGRMGDVINAQAAKEVFTAFSIRGSPKILEGAPGVSRSADVLSEGGVVSFNYLASPHETQIEALNKYVMKSIHGETFSSSLTNALYRTRYLSGIVGSTALANDACFDGLDTGIANQLQQVSRLIKKRDGLQATRNVFYTEIGGFDTHSDNGPDLTRLLTQIDSAIGCFKNEMVSQNIWNNVTLISASEFARTLSSNGEGTDHAWGGNHFIIGGSVKGGRIHGQYPSDLTENGILNIGQGRLIPTTPWEGVWNGLAEWFGVTSDNMSKVIPNKANFGGLNIFSKAVMFD